MLKDWFRTGTYVAALLIGLGFLAIFLAWNGAASKDFTQGQIPYLISGGVGGLGLILVGLAVLVVQVARRERAEVLDLLRAVLAALQAVPASPQPAPAGSRSRAGSGTDGWVVAGSASFHRPQCRLAEGRDDAQRMPRSEAEELGLKPCRICRP